MSTRSSADGDFLVAAGAALAVLRSAARSGYALSRERYLILPDERPVGREEATTLLAQLPKPISCVGLEAWKRLACGWWERSPEREPGWNARHRQSAAELMADVSEWCAGHDAEHPIALQECDYIHSMSVSACEEFLLSYHFPRISMNLAPASGRLANDGFAVVIKASRMMGAG